MRIVILPHGLLFTNPEIVNGQVKSGVTADGFKFSVEDGVEILSRGDITMRRVAYPQDLIHVAARVRGSPKDVIRWARRTHNRIFHKLCQ